MVNGIGLPAALKARGLTVEVVPGWETRSAGSLDAKGAICHWTAGPRGTTGRPSLNIVVNGRPDLQGPLCNVYLDRAGVAVVVAAGRANHAGAGNWRGLTGNSQLFGTECEAADQDDFTASQRNAYPKLNAAYCDLGGFGADMVAGHSEFALPAGRKQDINGYPMTAMRAEVAQILANPNTPGGFLMALNDDQQAQLFNWMNAVQGTLGSLNAYLNAGGDGDKVLRDAYNSATQARNAALQLTAMAGQQASAAMSPDQLADAIAKAIPDDLADAVAKKLGEKLAS
jgi:hypothetical protein